MINDESAIVLCTVCTDCVCVCVCVKTLMSPADLYHVTYTAQLLETFRLHSPDSSADGGSLSLHS